jgi:hypothetical protein
MLSPREWRRVCVERASVAQEEAWRMPRFHFEVRGAERFPDPEGVMLRSRASARREAARLSAALMRDYPDVFAEGRSWSVCILDAEGRTLETLDLESSPTD